MRITSSVTVAVVHVDDQSVAVRRRATSCVWQLINGRFPYRWIGMGGPVHWPPRSPDQTQMDFFLSGEMKRLVLLHPFRYCRTDSVARVAAATMVIEETPGIFGRTRCHLCVEVDGELFERL
ncbi:hypothetical protein ANN_19644 [Periplaneta americana]|uniref:Uncharacterized protein n=1 Tax=Periplaneta americana TaxID=6978 RepID=A0ABQ8SAG9_PERAM|nr:hypothetical protein ANN_19644 [Periplaneta americana]